MASSHNLKAPYIQESAKFFDYLSYSRVAQSSDYRFVLEIPIRRDFIPGYTWKKCYPDGTWSLIVEVAHKHRPVNVYMEDWVARANESSVIGLPEDLARFRKQMPGTEYVTLSDITAGAGHGKCYPSDHGVLPIPPRSGSANYTARQWRDLDCPPPIPSWQRDHVRIPVPQHDIALRGHDAGPLRRPYSSQSGVYREAVISSRPDFTAIPASFDEHLAQQEWLHRHTAATTSAVPTTSQVMYSTHLPAPSIPATQPAYSVQQPVSTAMQPAYVAQQPAAPHEYPSSYGRSYADPYPPYPFPYPHSQLAYTMPQPVSSTYAQQAAVHPAQYTHPFPPSHAYSGAPIPPMVTRPEIASTISAVPTITRPEVATTTSAVSASAASSTTRSTLPPPLMGPPVHAPIVSTSGGDRRRRSRKPADTTVVPSGITASTAAETVDATAVRPVPPRVPGVGRGSIRQRLGPRQSPDRQPASMGVAEPADPPLAESRPYNIEYELTRRDVANLTE